MLEEPKTLDEFNVMPKVMPEFWSCGLRLQRPLHSPVVFKNQIEVTLAASSLIRYKYKFFPANQVRKARLSDAMRGGGSRRGYQHT